MQEPVSKTALRRLAWIASAVALLTLAALPGVAAAKKKPKKSGVVGAMYTETNGTVNQLLAFNRYSNGHLTLRQAVNTGGAGGHQPEPGCMPPGGCPLLDAQGEVQVTSDGKLVFAVNAGSNTISSFAAGKHSLTLKDTVPSNGVFPNSITIHGNVLYVLNTNSESISGFRFSKSGTLTPIVGSTQPLTSEHAPLSRQIGFDNSGKVLVVSLLTDAAFDTFKVTGGVAGPATAHPSASPEPFAFSFDPIYNHMVDTEVVNDMNFSQFSNSSSYTVSKSGAVESIDTVPTQGYAACWTQITKDGKRVFVVNTGGPSPYGATVTSFGLSPNGKLKFKSVTTKDGEFTLTDEALSRDDKYLYVVAPLINNPFATPPPSTNGSKIVVFKVGKSGKLTRIFQTTNAMPPGLSGLSGN